MLTIFAVPKAFSGHIGIIQTNAIRSWMLLNPTPEVILFGDDAGTFELSVQLNIKHVAAIPRNEYGTPLINYLFVQAAALASNKILCYINSDIILTGDFVSTIQKIPFSRYLMVGRRWNLDITSPLDFSDPQWEEKLRLQIKEQGVLEGIGGIDYFVFPREIGWEMPDLTVGRGWWDNWLLYQARYSRIPLIDGTEAITAVHQNHDYAHHPQGKEGAYKGEESILNLQRMGGYEHAFSLEDADYIAKPDGLHRPVWTKKRLLREVHVWSIIHPSPTPFVKIIKMLFARRRWEDYNREYCKKRLRQLRNLLLLRSPGTAHKAVK